MSAGMKEARSSRYSKRSKAEGQTELHAPTEPGNVVLFLKFYSPKALRQNDTNPASQNISRTFSRLLLDSWMPALSVVIA